jgi:hypothetical protein
MDIKMETKKELSPEQREGVLSVLKARFEKNAKRHAGLDWAEVQTRLQAHPDKIWSLSEMERTGGEPDVVGKDAKTGEITFFDCSTESPAGRRNTCYDQEARLKRKVAAPASSALEMAQAMGAELMTEAEYRDLQQHEEFDLKTSSWLFTPEKVRKLGGAFFADRRYDAVFVYHNGADSYYAARGFRTSLKV